MDRLFRNKEIRTQIVAGFGITFVLMVLAAVFSGLWAALIVLVCGAALTWLNIHYLKKRYDSLSELARLTDRILHGQDELLINDSDEGELAILKSQISKMTAALRDSADQLKADKLRLSDAIADMFHQMRTPITSMNLQLSLLSSDDISSEKRRELVRELKKQLERLHWLTETLLKMSRLDAGTVEFRSDEVSFRTLMEKSCAPFLIPLEVKGVELITEDDGGSLACDLSWTAEAIGNLVKNCMEHTPPGGRISIDCRETALFSQVTVTDSGEGFDKDDLPHIFERFYKGKNSSDSSIGIGLALCRAIIAGQNGTITAQNAESGGASFIIKFYKTIV